MKQQLLLLVVLPFLAACPSLGTKINDMDEMEFDRLVRRTASWTQVAAWAAVDEEVVTEAQLLQAATAFDSLSGGTIVPGTTQVFKELFEVEGWGSAAFSLAMSELDIYLEGRGVWDDWGPRQVRLLQTVANALRSGVRPSTEEEAEVAELEAAA